ncbi:unnamed protein product [Cuscuta campestris]|uniref:Uncharacterized protein n=1 Tax=Cuscuta campestris TaxID=132261 RepID=A0A484KCD9_9ASTE|nr:unnamed protein product [Cuscuta campestris]
MVLKTVFGSLSQYFQSPAPAFSTTSLPREVIHFPLSVEITGTDEIMGPDAKVEAMKMADANQPERVQSLAQKGEAVVPAVYVQPPDNRSRINVNDSLHPVPTIDLSAPADLILGELPKACKEWGAFHVVNHGVSVELLDGARRVGRSFFQDYPMPEKLRYSCDPDLPASEGYGSRMLVASNDAVLDWRDYFDHHTLPLSRRDPSRWPHFPSDYSTQTALDTPSGFFTVHLASLKKGLRFPLHPLLIEFLNVVDLLPCQLVPNSHRYIAGYLVRCKDVGVKPTLDHFIFTFKLTKGHKDWASYARLSQRSSKLFASDKKGSTKDWKPFFVFVSTGPESPFTGSGRPSFRRIPCPPPDATLLSITRQFCNKGVVNIKEVVTEETLAGLGFEFVQDELRHQPDLLRDILGGHQPDQLKDIPEEGLDCGPFVELQDSGEEMESDLLLSRFTAGRKRKRETKGQGKRSSSHREEGPSREPAVIVVEDQEDATQEPGTMAGQSPPHPVMQGGDLVRSSQGIALERPPSPPAVTYEVATGGRSTRLCIPPLPQSLGDVQLETLITLPAEDQARISAGSEDDLDNMVLLRLSQATLGMIEVVGRKRGRQSAADEVMKAAEAKQKELQEEVARLTRELEEKENRCAALAVEKASQENRCVALEADKASLSLEVESVSARVVELEGEKSDLIQQLEVERSDRVRHAEEAVESFKSSLDFTVVAMERMEELTAAWLKTEPGAQWMVKEGTKSFNCGLFRAQQVFRDRLAQLPKGFSLPDLGFPPPCCSLAEFDPSPYLDGGSSSASEEEEEEEVEGGQSDQNPGASLAMSKAVWAQLLVPARLPVRAQSLDWPACRPIDPMPFTVSDWTFARLKAALLVQLPRDLTVSSVPSPWLIYKSPGLYSAPSPNIFLSSILAMSEGIPVSLNLSDGPAPSSPEPASSPKSVNSNDWGGLTLTNSVAGCLAGSGRR